MPISCAAQLSSFYLRSTENPFLSDGRFHALRELRIGACRSSEVYSAIFTQFPALELLEIPSYPRYPPYDTAAVVHTFQHLHTFILVGRGEYPQLWMLDILDLPSLKSLAISIWKAASGNKQVIEATHLSNFLMRCGGQLRRLKLAGDFLSCNDVDESLRHTPVLQSLCVESILLTGALTTLCPLLVQIDILVSHFSANRTLIAVDAILSQWQIRRLKKRARVNSPSIIRVPWYTLSAVLKHQSAMNCIQHGLRIGEVPCAKVSWWNPCAKPVDD